MDTRSLIKVRVNLTIGASGPLPSQMLLQIALTRILKDHLPSDKAPLYEGNFEEEDAGDFGDTSLWLLDANEVSLPDVSTTLPEVDDEEGVSNQFRLVEWDFTCGCKDESTGPTSKKEEED